MMHGHHLLMMGEVRGTTLPALAWREGLIPGALNPKVHKDNKGNQLPPLLLSSLPSSSQTMYNNGQHNGWVGEKADGRLPSEKQN
jgi:hypothetical protein